MLQHKNAYGLDGWSGRRYEVQGEYVIPSGATIPRSAAEMAAAAQPPNAANMSPFETGGGRWRLQVNSHLLSVVQPEEYWARHPRLHSSLYIQGPLGPIYAMIPQ